MGMIIAGAGQVSDSLILQPINPAANGSACPGQNVTLNCTAMQAAPGIIMTLSYNGSVIVSNSGTPTVVAGVVFTVAEFITGHLSVMSDVTIFSVPLSHHDSEITCETILVQAASSRITVAGNYDYTLPF